MIRRFLNQSTIWRRVVGNDGYQDAYAAPVAINVRWEAKRRLVRNKQGQEVVSEAEVLCIDPVEPGDILVFAGREWPVITVGETPDMSGKVYGRELSV